MRTDNIDDRNDSDIRLQDYWLQSIEERESGRNSYVKTREAFERLMDSCIESAIELERLFYMFAGFRFKG